MQEEEINLESSEIESKEPPEPESGLEPEPETPSLPHDESIKGEDLPQKNRKQSAKKEKLSAEIERFLTELELQKDIEAKLEFSFQYMKECISQTPPYFKGFWEARMKCLSFFKDNIAAPLRAQKWEEFGELSKEARRMKDQLDEQSSFASEQIDMAIQAMEKELEDLPELLKQETPPFLYLDGMETYALAANSNFYEATQKELHHLNLLATRISSLRKELIKTEMRIRTKNKFFDRLSKAGDEIFPRRKTLIHDLSQSFISDIDIFIQRHFHGNEGHASIFQLREEIKSLQHIAKVLTLNSLAFSKTRLALSECWDNLKEQDKERRIELGKRKDEFKKNEVEFKEMIEALAAKFDSGEHSSLETLTSAEQISKEMRNRELGRDEVKTLRTLLGDLKQKVHAKQREQEDKREQQEELRQHQRRELFQEFRGKIESLLNDAKELSSEEILEQKEELAKELQKSTLNKTEKADLEKLLKNLKDVLREKREIALRSLPDDDRQALEQLKELLKQKREERQEIKEILEHYRKQSGLSGVGFEKGLEYSARVTEERERYEKAQEAVEEVEIKIEELESKLAG